MLNSQQGEFAIAKAILVLADVVEKIIKEFLLKG